MWTITQSYHQTVISIKYQNDMKNQTIQFTYFVLLTLFILGCGTKKANKTPLPELTYFGEVPRIQNPLSPEDSQKHIQLPDGFEAVLYAAEPNIINPIAFAWDEKGRLWVVQSQDYPHELENDVGGDRITICEDTDGDGKADKFTDFATEQSLSTGLVIVKGGVIVAQAPEMVFLEDTDGDDKMDKRTVLFDGFGTYDTHAGPSNMHYGPDNQIWGSVGYSGFENQFNGKPINFTRGVYRFAKDGSSFEPIGQFNNNTWGMGFSETFDVFGSTANNNHACYVGIPLRHYDYLSKRPTWAINADFIQGHYEITPVDTVPLQQVDVRGGYTAAAGANFYTATNYPQEYRNQMYVNAPTGHLVHIAKIVEKGAGYTEEDGGNIFASTDAWTAPVFTQTGPDGNLWVADWYNPVIQHNPDKRGMENQIWNAERGKGNAHINPHRDKRHGRIYIIKHEDGQKSKTNQLSADNNKTLLAALQSENMFWRMTAQRLIVENNKAELIPEIINIAKKNTLGASHALWALDGLGAMKAANEELEKVLENALNSKIEGVQKTALKLIPASEKGNDLLLQSNLLTTKNLSVRLAAILRASELPETNELFQKMELVTQDEQNRGDKWLNAAIKIYFKEQNTESIDPIDVLTVVPAGDEVPSKWRYTESKPTNNWNSPDFDDNSWKEGEAAFGTMNWRNFIKTEWTSTDLWLRKEVTINEAIEAPVLKVIHDENYEVYVNGQLLFAEKGYINKYKYIRLADELSKVFKQGKNLIAVHVTNENGRQFIDVGIGKAGAFKADRVFTLNTVPQKMAYDKTTLHAMAGENIEIVLNNIDEMPHNLVLIQEGSVDIFGKLVDKFLASPDAAKMEYVPKSRYVLGATKMIDPEDSDVIRLRLPDKPGEYPFICTFPGHWRMMQGVIKVSARGSYAATRPDAPKIAVMGGGGSHQFLKFFGVADGKILNQDGANAINYTESPTQLNEWLKTADALVISNNKEFDAATKQTIFDRVNNGMPMLIYHPSTWYNWKDWPAYNKELVGGGSKSHEKLQEFEVIVKKPNHPIMKGVPKRFRITDELYRWEKDKAGVAIEVLAIGRGLASGEEFPVVWVVKHKNAKIVGNTLGHDEDAHGLRAYQMILNNSLNYVMGGKPNL